MYISASTLVLQAILHVHVAPFHPHPHSPLPGELSNPLRHRRGKMLPLSI